MQSMGRFLDPMSMEEPSRNFTSQIHFDIEAPGVSGRVNSVGGLAEAGRAQVPTDRRVSIAVPKDYPADIRLGHHPTAQSTRYLAIAIIVYTILVNLEKSVWI